MPTPKEQTVTYTIKGSGYDYMAMALAADGKPIHATFSFVKDREEIETSGFPNRDATVITGNASPKAMVQVKRAGKPLGPAIRTISADGKSMKLVGKITMPDGPKATYSAVSDKN